jgi:hypothetical protein
MSWNSLHELEPTRTTSESVRPDAASARVPGGGHDFAVFATAANEAEQQAEDESPPNHGDQT